MNKVFLLPGWGYFCLRAQRAVCQCRQQLSFRRHPGDGSPSSHLYSTSSTLPATQPTRPLSCCELKLLGSRSLRSLILSDDWRARSPPTSTTAFWITWRRRRKIENKRRTSGAYCRDENTCCYLKTSRQPTEVRSRAGRRRKPSPSVQASVRSAPPHNRRKLAWHDQTRHRQQRPWSSCPTTPWKRRRRDLQYLESTKT